MEGSTDGMVAPLSDRIARDEGAAQFYRRVLDVLAEHDVPYLIGGAYAFTRYTGIDRKTKDFDVFVRETDIERALDALRGGGYRTELTFPHWLGKVFFGDDFVDVIFSSGNGVAPVDDAWFHRATESEVLGLTVPVVAPEEVIWSKAFVMERERYDGADVVHVIHACAESLDWDHLLDRFGQWWRILLMNLILYGFVYPGERTRIPRRIMDELLRRMQPELNHNAPVRKLCQGTVVSRQQFLIDIDRWGYIDGRLAPRGNMSEEDVAHWTAAIDAAR